MLKGATTIVEYDECIRKGFCKEHLKEINQIGLSAVKNELPKKAFKFVRVNVLYPFLSCKPPKCEKMKKLMEKTPPISKIFIERKSGQPISEESVDVILTVDSVVIFTICQLSKICCIGAIFHTEKNSNDPNINAIQNLLLVERLNSNIRYLYPVLQDNFIGLDLDIIRATHCVTLLFIRKFCNKGSLKTAIEIMENDIKTNCEFDEVKVDRNEYSYKNMTCVIKRTSTSSSASTNFYSSKDYLSTSEFYYSDANYHLAIFYGYLAVSMEDSVGEAYFALVKALLAKKLFKDASSVLYYGLSRCEKNTKQHKKISKLIHGLTKRLDETRNGVAENLVNHYDIKDAASSYIKPKCQIGLVDLVDSDSDSEVKKKKQEVISKRKGKSKSKLPDCKKENSTSEKVSILDEKAYSDDEFVTKDVSILDEKAYSDDELLSKVKLLMMNRTKEKTKNKSCSSRRKRTVSEGAVDNQPKEEADKSKINSYLREASEALLVDCGYKAVQIFRGPLREFMESSNFLSFEECDIVCIKYSYGIAYCKSGGHDDLEKCIAILKSIIENHDSITFPAVYYSLGLAFRKLNRFKEALNYLEIVQNVLDKGIHFKIYSWPGMTTVIQETKPDILKDLVQALIKECENPPNPDAFCRYKNCSFQPTIYYTDPDFKGYISLFCSEQCNLQYHLQCWKTIKEEKKLTDKEFLEKQCFTPDCEGFFAKIQNIDKKGDLSKEFTSEFKKPQKLPKKWGKKTDVKEKEKKKKKVSIRSQGGSQEILTENGKDSSRKNSICESETIENKKEYSRESSICDNETTSPLSDSCISNEEISCKSGSNQKLSENLKLNLQVPVNSASNCVSNYQQESPSPDPVVDKKLSLSQEDKNDSKHIECIKKDAYSCQQENSSPDLVEDKKLSLSQEEKIDYKLIECIKKNLYSYMAGFLRHHGPLRIDDPLLTNEIESLPDEIYNIVSGVGGIGEFLKEDLEFAFVGALYVCIIDDLAKAYQMLSNTSLPTDFKSLESPEGPKYYCENGEISDTKHLSFLNPDAQEYTPSGNKSSAYKFETDDLNPQGFDSHCSLPLNLESSYKCSSSISELDTFSTTEVFVNKSKSREAVSDNKLQTNTESSFSSHSRERNPCATNESETDHLKPGSKMDDKSIPQDFTEKNKNSFAGSDKESTYDSSVESKNLKCKKIEAFMLEILNEYFSEEKKEMRQSMVSSLQPYILKKIEESAAGGIITNSKFQLDKSKKIEKSSAPSQDHIFEGLKKEIYDLSKQNSSLQNVLECTTEQQQKLTAEVTCLKKSLNDSAVRFENMKKEFDQKQSDLQKEKESLVQSLTNANKFIGSLQQKSASLVDEKLKLQKSVDNLTLSMKKEEDKMKNALDAQEKKFNALIESLQKENAELKNRTKHAELQVLYVKKADYLKKIEAKSLEVDEVLKEMNSSSLQLWATAAGPEQIKLLSTKLNNYFEELKAIKQDCIEKIDEQIKKVKSGVSLKDLKEVVMKDLAPVPTFKSILPENFMAGVSKFNSMTLPYFGTTPSILSPVSTPASLLSSATPLKVIPPTNIIPPVSPAIATNIIPPVAPVAAAKVISPVAPITATNIIPSVTPGPAIIPPCTPTSLASLSSSAHPNKDNKIDIANDVDPTIQESFKSAMASINSYASSPFNVQSLDDDFDKNSVVFKHPDPVSNNIKSNPPKAPPGLANSVPHSASVRASAITPIPEPIVKPSGEKSIASLDTVPKIKVAPNQSAWESEKKKTPDSYLRLLNKLKEQFPTYTQEELISYVKEVRTQRQGKLSGLTIDAIISEISAIMKTKIKIPDVKVQPKPAKVLVNKKLVPDPKPPPEPQTTKKKSAWNIDADAAQRRFSGSADDDCTICCDPMAKSAYKVACGHFFHEDCIRQWLKKNSNCPICRVLLLLPEEYPSLS